jgi:ribosomal protein L29
MLTRMTKRDLLVIVKHKDLEKYGIYEEDGRASYLTLKEIININEYLDTLFSHFESNDPEYDKNSILNEIDLYTDRYSLSRKQLDVLVDNLLIDDEKLQFHILRILKEYILDREIAPTNKDKLLKSLKEILGKYAGVSREHEIYRSGIIFMLGYFEDDSIIDWLKYDIEHLEVEKHFDKIKDDYGNIYTAWVIDKHKLELFNLINQFKKEGKDEEARLVYNIKHQVAKILGHIKEKEANF